eukprot:gb/GECG01003518.1/.p1 GENE.gb/GECG01003518.1/~~gb/GECG01003518.1/.p1  ORF type:complete len:313 (+),score=38.85 gb/GECG01003518.1/:1-939(+)
MSSRRIVSCANAVVARRIVPTSPAHLGLPRAIGVPLFGQCGVDSKSVRQETRWSSTSSGTWSYHERMRQEAYNRHKDYYKILGISPDASFDEVKKSFRELAKKYHPDVGTSEADPGLFKLIAEAYSVLSDEEKRRQYDAQFSSSSSHRMSEEDREKIRKKNEQFSEGFGTKFKPSTAGQYTRDTSAESAYTGAMQGALNRMRDDAYVRGRMNRQFRNRVYVPTKNESYISLFYLPMYAAAVLAAMWLLYKYVARSRAVGPNQKAYVPQNPPRGKGSHDHVQRRKKALEELEEKRKQEQGNRASWHSQEKARL